MTGTGLKGLKRKRVYREEFDVRKLGMPTVDLREEVDKEELEGLADSMVQYQMINPLIVTTDGRRYELVAGGRRVRAALNSGQFMQPAFVYDNLQDELKLAMQIVENVHQADFEPIWEARAYQIMMERDHKSIEQISATVKKPEARVRSRLRLLNLHPEIQMMVQRHELPSTTAAVVAEIADQEAQRAMAYEVKDKQLSYDVVKRIVSDSEKEAKRKRQLEQERKRKKREERERERQNIAGRSKPTSAAQSARTVSSPTGHKTVVNGSLASSTSKKASASEPTDTGSDVSSNQSQPRDSLPVPRPRLPQIKRPNVLPVKQQDVLKQKIAVKCEKFSEYLDRIGLDKFDEDRLRELGLIVYRLERCVSNFRIRIQREND